MIIQLPPIGYAHQSNDYTNHSHPLEGLPRASSHPHQTTAVEIDNLLCDKFNFNRLGFYDNFNSRLLHKSIPSLGANSSHLAKKVYNNEQNHWVLIPSQRLSSIAFQFAGLLAQRQYLSEAIFNGSTAATTGLKCSSFSAWERHTWALSVAYPWLQECRQIR